MKFFSLTSGILISIASVVAACSEDTTATQTTPEGGTSGSTGTGGSTGNTGGAANTGGKATGGGGSTGTGGKASGGSSGAGGSATGGSNAGGSAGDGGPGAGGTDGGGGRGGAAGAGGAPGDAGPTGCVAYCQLEESECTFGSGGTAQFANNGACMTACAQYPTTGQDGDPTGNTLQCRVTHLNNIVGGQAASLHCPHTGETPTAYCKAP